MVNIQDMEEAGDSSDRARRASDDWDVPIPVARISFSADDDDTTLPLAVISMRHHMPPRAHSSPAPWRNKIAKEDAQDTDTDDDDDGDAIVVVDDEVAKAPGPPAAPLGNFPRATTRELWLNEARVFAGSVGAPLAVSLALLAGLYAGLSALWPALGGWWLVATALHLVHFAHHFCFCMCALRPWERPLEVPGYALGAACGLGVWFGGSCAFGLAGAEAGGFLRDSFFHSLALCAASQYVFFGVTGHANVVNRRAHYAARGVTAAALYGLSLMLVVVMVGYMFVQSAWAWALAALSRRSVAGGVAFCVVYPLFRLVMRSFMFKKMRRATEFVLGERQEAGSSSWFAVNARMVSLMLSYPGAVGIALLPAWPSFLLATGLACVCELVGNEWLLCGHLHPQGRVGAIKAGLAAARGGRCCGAPARRAVAATAGPTAASEAARRRRLRTKRYLAVRLAQENFGEKFCVATAPLVTVGILALLTSGAADAGGGGGSVPGAAWWDGGAARSAAMLAAEMATDAVRTMRAAAYDVHVASVSTKPGSALEVAQIVFGIAVSTLLAVVGIVFATQSGADLGELRRAAVHIIVD